VAQSKPLSAKAAKALSKFEDTTTYHSNYVDKARRRYRSYLGILEPRSEAASWTSQLAPPYVRNNVETQLAGLTVDKIAFAVKPRPKLYSPEELESARRGAKAHEILHHFQFAQDRFDEMQRPLGLQNAIVGFCPVKTFWRSESRRSKRLEAVDVGLEQMGIPTGIYDLREVEATVQDFNGPCSEVVNVEDFFWHEAATDVQRSPTIAHRVWMHFAELKEGEAQGAYQNVDQLKESIDQGTDFRLYDSDDRQRTKDMIEVLEIYYRGEGGIWVCTLGNRKVELKPCRPLPFWHGEYPFVIASTEPDLFQIPGLSQVAKTAHLQEAIHDFLNQTSDNVRLINNFIIGVNDLVEDPDALVHAPGERWPVEGSGDINKAISVFKPDAITAQVALPMIAMLQKDLQTLGGSQPFTSTSEAGRVGADTATEAALVTNIAQQSTKMQQRQLMLAYKRIGQQRTELNKQFIRRSLAVPQMGMDSEEEFTEIMPHILQGDYDFDISPMAESLMRSERRAEANALIQTAAQIMPIWLSLAQAGAATLPNFDAFTERWLEGFDEEPRQFFSAKPPPAAVPPAGIGGQQQANGAAPTGGGVTAQQSIDPSVSPSSQSSLSPEVFAQRMNAMRGGVANT